MTSVPHHTAAALPPLEDLKQLRLTEQNAVDHREVQHRREALEGADNKSQPPAAPGYSHVVITGDSPHFVTKMGSDTHMP